MAKTIELTDQEYQYIKKLLHLRRRQYVVAVNKNPKSQNKRNVKYQYDVLSTLLPKFFRSDWNTFEKLPKPDYKGL